MRLDIQGSATLLSTNISLIGLGICVLTARAERHCESLVRVEPTCLYSDITGINFSVAQGCRKLFDFVSALCSTVTGL